MSGTTAVVKDDDRIDNHSIDEKQTGFCARKRWYDVLALADQIRHETKAKKNEQLRQYAFEIPKLDGQESTATTLEAQADHVNSFQYELLSSATGNLNLDNLAKNFLALKYTFNRMIELNKDDMEQITLATSITKTALLIVLRSIESIVEIVTKGTRNFPTLNSLISYIRSRHTELPIDGRLLVDWYQAARTLDLLTNDPDWLVQPRKAHWAMHVCNETLAWTRVVFNDSYRKTRKGRPIFDRDDSTVSMETYGQE